MQSADSPELNTLIKHSYDDNIGLELNQCLSDIQAMVSIVTVGLPQKAAKSSDLTKVIPNHDRELTPVTCNILSRLANYNSSMMLGDKHPIKGMAKKIFFDYVPLTRRGRAGATSEDMLELEDALINRVNPFSKTMAQIMLSNQSDDLHDFDGFNTIRSIIDPDSVYSETCNSCDGSATHCVYKPQISSFFEIEASYCYRCGDKAAGMVGMPTIMFTCDEYNKTDLTIHYEIKFISQQRGDVYFGIQLPGYVEDSVITDLQVERLKFKKPGVEKTIGGCIAFKEDTILQSYYLKLFAVQNGGISIDRCFFNLV